MLTITRSSTAVWSVDPSGTAAPTEPIELGGWRRQPLLGFLGRLREAVDAAQRSGQSSCYLIDDRDLIFAVRAPSRLEVTSQSGDTTAAAPIHEFDDAIACFEEDARAWLEGQAPHLMAHPSWAEWFPSREP